MDGTETTQYDTEQSGAAIEFMSCFPSGRIGINSKPGEAVKIVLDAYPNPGERKSVLFAKLAELMDSEANFIVTIQPDE